MSCSRQYASTSRSRRGPSYRPPVSSKFIRNLRVLPQGDRTGRSGAREAGIVAIVRGDSGARRGAAVFPGRGTTRLLRRLAPAASASGAHPDTAGLNHSGPVTGASRLDLLEGRPLSGSGSRVIFAGPPARGSHRPPIARGRSQPVTRPCRRLCSRPSTGGPDGAILRADASDAMGERGLAPAGARWPGKSRRVSLEIPGHLTMIATVWRTAARCCGVAVVDETT